MPAGRVEMARFRATSPPPGRYMLPVDSGVVAEEEAGRERGLAARLAPELPGLRAFLGRLAGPADRAEVEDLVQESAARALSYGGSFEPGRALGPWVRGIAFRVFLDHRDRRQRRPAELAGAEARIAVPARDELERREWLQHLLGALRAPEREVLVRFHQRGESIRDIARALGFPHGTVKSHLHRARRRLAELVREEDRR